VKRATQQGGPFFSRLPSCRPPILGNLE
jgi:hypothetical protein